MRAPSATGIISCNPRHRSTHVVHHPAQQADESRGPGDERDSLEQRWQPADEVQLHHARVLSESSDCPFGRPADSIKRCRFGSKTLSRCYPEASPLSWNDTPRHELRTCRPRTRADIEQLLVRIATENSGWGYTRILGALNNLGIHLGCGTIQRMLKPHLIEPAPIRRKWISWSTFLMAHWRGLAAGDYFTVEVWSLKGLLTF